MSNLPGMRLPSSKISFIFFLCIFIIFIVVGVLSFLISYLKGTLSIFHSLFLYSSLFCSQQKQNFYAFAHGKLLLRHDGCSSIYSTVIFFMTLSASGVAPGKSILSTQALLIPDVLHINLKCCSFYHSLSDIMKISFLLVTYTEQWGIVLLGKVSSMFSSNKVNLPPERHEKRQTTTSFPF